MQNSKRYFRIGVFAAAALLLLVFTMFFLGLMDEFAPRIRIVTTFSKSVQGLTKGSAVKLKGVPIGSVDRIAIIADGDLIRVDMSIDPEVFLEYKKLRDKDEHISKVTDFMRKCRERGLSCQLNLAGITGLRYVEMDFVSEKRRRKEPLPEINEKDVIYFPSVPGTFNNIIDSVALSLDRIAQVDVNQIAINLDKNLQSLNTILNNPSIKNSIERIEKISANIESVSGSIAENMSGEDFRKLVDGVNSNLESIRILTRQLNEKLMPMNTQELNSRINEVLNAGKLLVEELNDGSRDAARTIQQLNVVLNNLNDFISQIKQDPGSLVRGRSSKPVDLD